VAVTNTEDGLSTTDSGAYTYNAPSNVTFNTPDSPTNKPTPNFSGSTSSNGARVVVHIFSGSMEVTKFETTPSGGGWSGTSSHLEDGTYTAQATQEIEVGNIGSSNTVTFTVDTTAPLVSLNPVSSVTGDSTPTLTGGAGLAPGDSATIDVIIHEGSSVNGKVFTSGSTTAKVGAWSFTSSHLPDGTYTAQATQADSAGNVGLSEPPSVFTVDTASPEVTLNTPESPSNNTTPSFTGFASDTTPVVVQIFNSSNLKVAEATATHTGGDWTSGNASPPLTSGQYTARATQASSLGNPEGKSSPVTFTVSTASPVVTLKTPPTPSKDTTPSFTGTATDSTSVVVHIFNSAQVQVSSATAIGTPGAWESGDAKALPDGVYTAVATQESSLGNKPGESAPVHFTVDTTPPVVTLDPVAALSNDSTPTLMGTAGTAAGDLPKVTVTIYKGTSVGGTVAESPTATATIGGWSLTASHLADGTYTAQASQADESGNVGKSEPAVTFTIDTAPPEVTLTQPAALSANPAPFSGTATDATTVTVEIYAGATVKGSPVSTATATPSAGKWTSGEASPKLVSGQYTAVAEQPSSLGNKAGESTAKTFTVNTASPTVTLNQPTSPSNDTIPTFTGTASDTTPVTINVHEGSTATGKLVTTASASSAGGAWTSGQVAKALTEGTYTAVAVETSSLGNPPGESAAKTFVVVTVSPKVTLTAPKVLLSNNTTPSFTGTATDTTAVTVQIHEGAASGAVVSTATATVTGGTWTSANATPALVSGKYTAIAVQPSSAGNPPGESGSVAFTVETAPPKVTLTQPASPSNNKSPSFTGSASDSTQVVVHISLEGAEVAKATATPSGGVWTATNISQPLSAGLHTYTAVAVQESSLGNKAGESAPVVTFVVNTEPPTVTLTPPVSQSNVTAPTFSGTASDTTHVTVDIYKGTKVGVTVVSTATATPTGGTWASTKASPELLVNGKYTAIAVQESSITGNPSGTSSSATFTVDTADPSVSINAPSSSSWTNSTTPSFTGIATDKSEPVSIHIFNAADTQVAEASATGTGGIWTSGPASPALANGKYTAVASQKSSFGNDTGEAKVPFIVDTIPPVVSLTSSVATSSTSETVGGAAGTEEGDLSTVTAQLFSGAGISAGQASVREIEVGVSGKAWSFNFAGLQPGTYTARAEQFDKAGNIGLSSPSTFVISGGGSAPPPAGPAASFTWFPAAPHTGETVSLASSSTDATTPITGFAWDPTGKGVFVTGSQVITTTFSTPGNHLVHLNVTAANGLSSTATETIPVTSPPLVLMRPFPIVRITSSDTNSGAVVHLLRVQASAGARVTVTCKGHGCPIQSAARSAVSHKGKVAPLEFLRFERSLRAGITLIIRVSKPGQIGKYTSFVVRRGRLPLRTDTCLASAGVKPIACP